MASINFEQKYATKVREALAGYQTNQEAPAGALTVRRAESAVQTGGLVDPKALLESAKWDPAQIAQRARREKILLAAGVGAATFGVIAGAALGIKELAEASAQAYAVTTGYDSFQQLANAGDLGWHVVANGIRWFLDCPVEAVQAAANVGAVFVPENALTEVFPEGLKATLQTRQNVGDLFQAGLFYTTLPGAVKTLGPIVNAFMSPEKPEAVTGSNGGNAGK